MLHRHPILSFVTVLYLAAVAWITLGPQPLDAHGVDLLERVIAVLQRHAATDWVTYSRVEFAANIAMFVPMGLFFLLLMGRRYWWLAVLLCLVATVSIETAQQGIPGRISDPRDIVSNTFGGAVGVIVGLVLTWRPGAARRRAAAERAAERAA